MAEASISQLDETIISRPATTPDEGIAKLELARDLAAAKGKTKIVKLIEGALMVLRHQGAAPGSRGKGANRSLKGSPGRIRWRSIHVTPALFEDSSSRS